MYCPDDHPEDPHVMETPQHTRHVNFHMKRTISSIDVVSYHTKRTALGQIILPAARPVDLQLSLPSLFPRRALEF